MPPPPRVPAGCSAQGCSCSSTCQQTAQLRLTPCHPAIPSPAHGSRAVGGCSTPNPLTAKRITPQKQSHAGFTHSKYCTARTGGCQGSPSSFHLQIASQSKEEKPAVPRSLREIMRESEEPKAKILEPEPPISRLQLRNRINSEKTLKCNSIRNETSPRKQLGLTSCVRSPPSTLKLLEMLPPSSNQTSSEKPS